MKRFLLCLAFLLPIAGAAAAASQPNIVFIFSDDHGTQALGAYGSSLITTPHMDRLAREGTRFDRCYVTNSLCGPSRAVVLTGKYSHLNGFLRNYAAPFDGSQQTFPKLLRAAGYQTAVIGKWHLQSTPTGFDHFDILIDQGPYYNPPMLRKGRNGEPVKIAHTGYTTEIITEKSIDWLQRQRDPDKPFLLMIQHKAPHRNWQPAPKYVDWLDDVTLPEPATLFDDYSGRTRSAARQSMTLKEHLTEWDLKLTRDRGQTPEQQAVFAAAYDEENAAFAAARAGMSEREILRWKYQRFAKDYLRCVKSVDDSVGDVMAYLTEAGLLDNTIVVYSSDQGWYLGEHGWYDKRWMYEQSLRTPLIVRWPARLATGAVRDEIVSNLDFAPTFLDFAGVKIPEDMQGRSLRPLLEGRTVADWRKSFYYHYYQNPGTHDVARHYGVTTGRYKLIHFYELDEQTIDDWELFDLQRDPHEMHSVYGDPEYARIQAELKAEIRRLRRHYQVPDVDPDRQEGRS